MVGDVSLKQGSRSMIDLAAIIFIKRQVIYSEMFVITFRDIGVT